MLEEGVELALRHAVDVALGHIVDDNEAEMQGEAELLRLGVVVAQGLDELDALIVVEREVLEEGVELALRHAVDVALGHIVDDSEADMQGEAELLRLGVVVAQGVDELDALTVGSREMLEEGVELVLRHAVAVALGQSEDDCDVVAHGDEEALRLGVDVAQGEGLALSDREGVLLPLTQAVAEAERHAEGDVAALGDAAVLND